MLLETYSDTAEEDEEEENNFDAALARISEQLQSLKATTSWQPQFDSKALEVHK